MQLRLPRLRSRQRTACAGQSGYRKGVAEDAPDPAHPTVSIRIAADTLEDARSCSGPRRVLFSSWLIVRRIKMFLELPIVQERSNVGEILARKLDLATEIVSLANDHWCRAAPHLGEELERVYGQFGRSGIEFGSFVAADAIDDVAHYTAFTDK